VKDEPKVRIVVRKPKHGQGHHGGAWKVAYADFVTTMMALFIVLWIIGQNEAAKQGIAHFFRNPGLFKQGPAASPFDGGAGVLPGEPPPPPASPPAPPPDEEHALQEAAEHVKDIIKQGGGFEELREQIRIEITPEGLRIEIMEREDTPFFDVGSAVPIYPLGPLLERLRTIVGKLPNHITIEGHTDARQYSRRRDYSNWELSTDRANTARRILEADGLRPGQIDRIVGHADRVLRRPDDPLHPSNRRITLLVRRQGY
jgi:chemotaxis protein MotB